MKIKMFFASLFLALSLSVHAQGGFMAVANVSKIHGTAFVNKEKIKEGQEIAENMMISFHNAKDFIDVKFQNGHVVRFVGASVKVKVLNPKNYLFELMKGKIYSVIKPLTKDETFGVKTKRATFAVSGTRFFIEESKNSSYLYVSEGAVTVKTDKGQLEVKKDEDVLLAPKRDLKSSLAAKSMGETANAVFKDMGI